MNSPALFAARLPVAVAGIYVSVSVCVCLLTEIGLKILKALQLNPAATRPPSEGLTFTNYRVLFCCVCAPVTGVNRAQAMERRQNINLLSEVSHLLEGFVFARTGTRARDLVASLSRGQCKSSLTEDLALGKCISVVFLKAGARNCDSGWLILWKKAPVCQKRQSGGGERLSRGWAGS